MGDGADMALEACMSLDAHQLEYLSGTLPTQEAIDCGILDERGVLPRGPTWPTHSRPRLVTCRCCGTSGLKWMRHGEKWLVGDGVTLHDCPVNPYTPNTEAKGTDQ